ncbi:TPA: coiled-coil domain-containing protein [Enterococcus faecalis]
MNKRKDLLRNQARDIQTSDSSNSLMETLLSSESISDAINKAVASITIMNASNSIVEQQQMDIEKSVVLEKELEKKLADIEDQSSELDKKQRNLVDIKLGQELEIAELSLSLNTEEEKKQKLIEERDEAEKKKKLALEALEKQRKIEEEAKRMADLEVSKKQETSNNNSAENAELVDEKPIKENPSETSKSEENVVSDEEKSNVDLSSK